MRIHSDTRTLLWEEIVPLFQQDKINIRFGENVSSQKPNQAASNYDHPERFIHDARFINLSGTLSGLPGSDEMSIYVSISTQSHFVGNYNITSLSLGASTWR